MTTIQYDFNNARDFMGTIPLDCEIGGHVVRGKYWINIFVAVIEMELQDNNPRLKALYNEPLGSKRSSRPFFLKEKLEKLQCSRLSNGFWVNVNWNIPEVINLVGRFCLYCGYQKEQIILYGIPKNMPQNAVQPGKRKKEETGSSDISERLSESICRHYPKGLRFDETVLRLLEEYSGCRIDQRVQTELRKAMFKRQDGLWFLPDMIADIDQGSLLQNNTLLEILDKYGCVVVDVLYEDYIAGGDSMVLRNADDFGDYLTFLMPGDIRIANVLSTKIIRRNGTKLEDMIQNTVQLVVKTIEESGCMGQEDILNVYPVLSESFLRKLLEKYADGIVTTNINDYLCYQTIESLGIDTDFSLNLHDVLDEIRRLSLTPSQDIIHALLSVRLGYNVREEWGLADDRTFRRIISRYYDDDRQRIWKAGCFVEAAIDYV